MREGLEELSKNKMTMRTEALEYALLFLFSDI
jgi:hypothetical protein